MKLPWLVLLAFALAGCSDDGGDAGADDPAEADPGVDDGMGASDAGDSPMPAEPEIPAEIPTRWVNQTAVVGLADCTVIAALVGAGAPGDQASQAISVSLSEEDWGREYDVEFLGDALSNGGAPASAPAALCVGFDDFLFAAGTSGDIPEGAETMVIGGDFLLQGDLSVRIGPEP